MFKCGILKSVCIGVVFLDLSLKLLVDLLLRFLEIFFLNFILGIKDICLLGNILFGM